LLTSAGQGSKALTDKGFVPIAYTPGVIAETECGTDISGQLGKRGQVSLDDAIHVDEHAHSCRAPVHRLQTTPAFCKSQAVACHCSNTASYMRT